MNLYLIFHTKKKKIDSKMLHLKCSISNLKLKLAKDSTYVVLVCESLK